MKIVQEVVLIWIFLALFLQNATNVEGRHHYHKSQKKNNPDEGSSSTSPVPPPEAQDPAPPSPAYSPVPTVPSDPSPKPSNSSSGCIYDVTAFGAVGDGSADDTPAFTTAWKAACAVESGVVLAPAGYTFTITSTIFSGPCKPGLVFQVRMGKILTSFPCISLKIGNTTSVHFGRHLLELFLLDRLECDEFVLSRLNKSHSTAL